MKTLKLWAFICLLMTCFMSSCRDLYHFQNNISRFKITADVNNTDYDRAAINYYNYVVDLYDSLSMEENDSNMISLFYKIQKFKMEIEINHNVILKQQFQNNFDKINNKLDEIGIPREFKVNRDNDKEIKNVKFWSYYNQIPKNELIVNGLGVDKDGLLYSYIRRDDRSGTLLEVKSDKIKHNGKTVCYIIEPKIHKEGCENYPKHENKGRVVNLNEFFNNYDTDYSATEFSPEEELALKNAGIYYDEKSDCYRQK